MARTSRCSSRITSQVPSRPPSVRQAHRKASFSNMLGSIIVQRYGSLIKGRRTNAHRMSKSFTADARGDAGRSLARAAKRHLDNIEMIQALNYVAPGMTNDNAARRRGQVLQRPHVVLTNQLGATAHRLRDGRRRRRHARPLAGRRQRCLRGAPDSRAHVTQDGICQEGALQAPPGIKF